MHIVLYKLKNGRVPKNIKDGGYFPDLEKDYLLGLATKVEKDNIKLTRMTLLDLYLKMPTEELIDLGEKRDQIYQWLNDKGLSSWL